MGLLAELRKNRDTTNNDIVNVMTHKSRIDVMIGMPSWRGGVEPDTQICLDQLVYHNVQNDCLVTVKKTMGSMIADNRNNVAKAAIEAGAKKVLFIDTDMVFPKDSIQQMLACDKPVVSALAVSKSYPYVPNMYERQGRDGWKPIIKWKKGELLEVDCVGGAFLLVDTDVLKKVKPPWFASPPMHDYIVSLDVRELFDESCDVAEVVDRIRKTHNNYRDADAVLGEDFYFSERLREAGVPIHVDTSLQIGHVGSYMYSINDFEFHREDYEQKYGGFK